MKRKWQRMVLLERAPESAGALPKSGFARLEQIIGDAKATPAVASLIPVSKKSTGFAARGETCRACGSVMNRKRRNSLYCSNACRQRAYRDRSAEVAP
jgi:hypothetical protein